MENGETKSNLLPNGTVHKDEKFSGLLSQLKALAQRCAVLNLLLIVPLVITVIILPIILTARPASIPEPCPAAAACSVAACPEGWVGYRGKCYYFSEPEATWTDSQNSCSVHGASLAGIDSQREMDFIRRYKEPHSRYWIGLRREPGQPWKWTNGTIFSDWFAIAGGERCAFLNNGHCGSSHCSGEGRWICSKPARSPDARQTPPCPMCPPSVAATCPDGWVGFQGKCFYFSETEGNWSASQSHCASLNASLATVDSLPELTFMQRYKGIPLRWISLQREQIEGQPWKWTNGTMFNSMSEVAGEGQSTYLSARGVSSARCYLERHFICSRPDECSRRKPSATRGDTVSKIAQKANAAPSGSAPF